MRTRTGLLRNERVYKVSTSKQRFTHKNRETPGKSVELATLLPVSGKSSLTSRRPLGEGRTSGNHCRIRPALWMQADLAAWKKSPIPSVFSLSNCDSTLSSYYSIGSHDTTDHFPTAPTECDNLSDTTHEAGISLTLMSLRVWLLVHAWLDSTQESNSRNSIPQMEYIVWKLHFSRVDIKDIPQQEKYHLFTTEPNPE